MKYNLSAYRETEVDQLGRRVVQGLQLGDKVDLQCHRILSEILHTFGQFPVQCAISDTS